MCSRRRLLLFGAAFILLFSCRQSPGLPYYNSAVFTPVWTTAAAARNMHRVPVFSLVDQNSDTVSGQTFRGKIYIANFFFTSCGSICPVMMKNLLKVQRAFPGDTGIAILSHSVAPWVDSVDRLKHYSEKYGFDTRWHLLTGNKAYIYRLARQGYFAEEEPGYTKDSTEFLHTEHVLLIDPNRHIRGVYNGTLELEIDRMIADIRLLRDENRD
jgi:protein SCO1/2